MSRGKHCRSDDNSFHEKIGTKPHLQPLDLRGELVILILFNRMLRSKICFEFWVRLFGYLQLLTLRGSDFPEIKLAFFVE